MDCTCPKARKPSMDRPDLHHRECEVYIQSAPSILAMTQRMRRWILSNARHDILCRHERDCKGRHYAGDSRVACVTHPCSCGLSAILDDLEPSVVHQLEEEDDGPGESPLDFSA